MERDEVGAFDDDLDRLLPVKAAHVAPLVQRADAVAVVVDHGGFEGEVIGSDDVDSGDAVVVYLLKRRHSCLQ